LAKFIDEQEIIAKASKGFIKDYYSSGTYPSGKKTVMKPTRDLSILTSLMKDSTFNTEVNVLVDGIMNKTFKIVDRKNITKRDVDKELTFERQHRSFKLIRQILLNLLVYRNSFIEIEYKNNSPYKLNPLETTQMDIDVTPHGEILGYVQEVLNGFSDKSYVNFSNDECVHISPSKLSNNPWGYTDTQSIENVVAAKIQLEDYINHLFETNSFRNIWNIKKATGSTQVKNFMDSILQARANPNKDIVVEGDIEQKQLRNMDDFEYMLRLHENYKSMIREFLRVPPIMVGDSTSKSTGEFQVRYSFSNTVRAWQRIIEDEFTNEVFPLLGWSTSRLLFFNSDVPNEEKYISMAVQLKGLGYTNDSINEFLLLKGVELPANAEIEEIEAPVEGDNPDNPIINQKLQNMNAPSRKASDKSQVDKKMASDVTTREEQIIGKGSTTDFNTYPYTIK